MILQSNENRCRSISSLSLKRRLVKEKLERKIVEVEKFEKLKQDKTLEYERKIA